MNFNVQYSDTFKREANKLAKKYPSLKQDLAALVNDLAKTPNMGTPLGRNMFKVRMSIRSKSRGK